MTNPFAILLRERAVWIVIVELELDGLDVVKVDVRLCMGCISLA